MRLPKHVGVIPDGNRRWAQSQGMSKDKGYDLGIDPGLEVFKICRDCGIKEITYYGFTTDNVKRPQDQRIAFTNACIKAVETLSKEDVDILVVGNTNSNIFPKELLKYTKRQKCGKGGIKVNFLINYGWEWDLKNLIQTDSSTGRIYNKLNSYDISRIDLIIRWGGRRRLSGFLPVQSIYSDFYIVDDLWPDFKPEHVKEALKWYDKQDITLGG